MHTARDWFEGRQLVIATMHGKEQVLAPLLQQALGVQVQVHPAFNTDQFGTFTGEVERVLSPLETARLKCITAMELTGADLAVASEGSFGPHPFIGFIQSDEELLLLYDRKHDRQIIAKALSTETNFNAGLCNSWQEVQAFAAAALFPSHALILRPAKADFSQVVKGVHDWQVLEQQTHEFLNRYRHVYIETDMRALHNPSRMKVIEAAAAQLIEKVNRLCPSCNAPGFDVVEVVPGLPCSWCGTPTNSTQAFIFQCASCSYRQEQRFPHGKETEDPMYCNHCNP